MAAAGIANPARCLAHCLPPPALRPAHIRHLTQTPTPSYAACDCCGRDSDRRHCRRCRDCVLGVRGLLQGNCRAVQRLVSRTPGACNSSSSRPASRQRRRMAGGRWQAASRWQAANATLLAGRCLHRFLGCAHEWAPAGQLAGGSRGSVGGLPEGVASSAHLQCLLTMELPLNAVAYAILQKSIPPPHVILRVVHMWRHLQGGCRGGHNRAMGDQPDESLGDWLYATGARPAWANTCKPRGSPQGLAVSVSSLSPADPPQPDKEPQT